MMPLVPEFTKALPVLKKIEEAGFEAYFVGGSVRDFILQKKISDVDIATSAFPAEIKAIFPKTIDVGIEHGTVMALWQKESYEITTFRTESTYQDYRRPDKVVFVRSLKEDLKRRDFTVNALAMDANGKIIDYFDGVRDIENQLLKAVGSPSERFHEDALRMMRGIRFVSQLDFNLDEETEEAILKHHALLEKIAVERIQVEFIKLLLGNGRSRGLEKLIQTELYVYCPGLRNSGEGLYQFANLVGTLPDSLTAWTLLIYYIQLKCDEIEDFLRQWKCSKKEIHDVQIAKKALDERLIQNWSVDTLYQTGIDRARSVEHMRNLLLGNSDFNQLEVMFKNLPIYNKKEIDVSGNELISVLNKQPGIWLGKMLSKIEHLILHGELKNEKKAILSWAKQQLEES